MDMTRTIVSNLRMQSRNPLRKGNKKDTRRKITTEEETNVEAKIKEGNETLPNDHPA
jgi:hypothetical protein